jgi:lysophospholipase L1-like esterase
MRRTSVAAAALACLILARQFAAADQPKLTLPEKSVIAWIGNTLVERDIAHGYLETRLLTAFPDRPIVFRNLGWSGDTVRGEARAGFGKPIDGFNHLAKHVAELKPNVILLYYGLNESFAGPAGLDAFNKDLAKLLDTLEQDKPQIVIFGQMRLENLGPPLPDPAAANANIALYNESLQKAAEARNHRFVNLFDVANGYTKPARYFTDNGLHLTATGYAFVAHEMIKRLGLPDAGWNEKLEKIRQLTVEKNTLYFHRWRPQNETYIFGFRKKEQGQNAVEIPQFDPLIAEKESQINALLKK